MDFVTKKIGKKMIFAPENKVFSASCAKNILKKAKNTPCAIDCTNIERFFDAKTLEIIIENNIALCSAKTELICQISLLNTKKFPRVFLNTQDFICGRRILVKRRFKVA